MHDSMLVKRGLKLVKARLRPWNMDHMANYLARLYLNLSIRFQPSAVQATYSFSSVPELSCD
jgi:hypothetical protein